MTLKEALERIEALERKVRELESRPTIQYHYHQYPAPYYPIFPNPIWISPTPTPLYTITCAQGNDIGAINTTMVVGSAH